MSVTLHQVLKNRDEVIRIAGGYGARNLRVFGSVARNETRTDSDLDLLVEFDEGRTLFDLGGLVADLEDFFGCKVDVVSENGLKPRFREHVLRDAVSL